MRPVISFRRLLLASTVVALAGSMLAAVSCTDDYRSALPFQREDMSGTPVLPDLNLPDQRTAADLADGGATDGATDGSADGPADGGPADGMRTDGGG